MSPYLRAGYRHARAVDEDGDLFRWVGDVRAAGHLLIMQPVAAAAGGPERPAECEFRSGIPPAIRAHHPRGCLALRHRRSLVSDVHLDNG